MANSSEQNLASHARIHPWFHYFTLPIFAINFVTSIVRAIRFQTLWNDWLIVMSFAALSTVFLIRYYALRVQDRVIRLEERVRMGELLFGPVRQRIPELTMAQLIALRFVSDDELPALTERALNEKLSGRQIKQAIRVWRPDHYRV